MLKVVPTNSPFGKAAGWYVKHVFPSLVRYIKSLYEVTCKVGLSLFGYLVRYFTSQALNTRQANFKAKYSTPVRPRANDFTLVLCIANYYIVYKLDNNFRYRCRHKAPKQTAVNCP